MNIPVDKFESYLESRNLKPRSIENYVYYFNKFTYDSFDQESVARFLSKKENRNQIARSFLSNLKRFLKVNYKELGYSKQDKEEIMDVELPKQTGRKKTKVINPLTEDQILALEKYLDSEKLKIMLLFSYYCGLRLGEILGVKISSFNWEEWKKNKSEAGECIVFGKGSKEGPAYIPSFLMKRIQEFVLNNNFESVNSYLFVSTQGPINTKNAGSFWQKKLREIGIKSGITQLDNQGNPVPGTSVHPHRLRHSYGAYLKLVKGLDAFEIKDLMRHSSITSTQVYINLDKKHLKDKINI